MTTRKPGPRKRRGPPPDLGGTTYRDGALAMYRLLAYWGWLKPRHRRELTRAMVALADWRPENPRWRAAAVKMAGRAGKANRGDK